MFCGNCGKQIEDFQKICPYCGKSVGGGQARQGGQTGGANMYQQPYQQNMQNMYQQQYPAQRRMAAAGLSVGMFGALIYWSGLLNSIVLALLAGYVLVHEKDTWLRAVALKGLLILIVFALLDGMIGLVTNGKGIIIDILRMADAYASWESNFNSFFSIVRTVLEIIRDVILIFAGFLALGNKNFRVGIIDGMVNNHIGPQGGK